MPGQPGGAWSDEEVSIVREKVQEMLNPANYRGYHLQWCDPNYKDIGLFVCDKSVYDMVPFIPEKKVQDNEVNCNMRCPKTSRVIQLAFHDCMTYTEGAAEGSVNGCDGCLNMNEGIGFEFKETWFVGNDDKPPAVNHFTKSYPIKHKTDNNGLEGSVRALEMIYTDPAWPSSARSLNISLKDSGKSRADLWAFAGNVALEMEIVRANYACDVDLKIQQVTVLEGRERCDIKLHRPIKFRSGRVDCIPEEDLEAPYMTSRVENHDNPWGHGNDAIANFKRDFNLSAEETIALLAAHGVRARGHNKILATKYAWPGTPYLSNMFFKHWAMKPTYTLDPDVDGFESLALAITGDKAGRPVDNYGYRLVCTAMWNLTDTTDDGPCYFKRQPNLGKGDVHRASSIYASPDNFGTQKAVDGVVTDYGWDWFSTESNQVNPWIELQLSSPKTVTSISFSSRMDCCWEFLRNLEIRAGMEPIGESPAGAPLQINSVCGMFTGPVQASQRGEDIRVVCSQPIEAKYITLQILGEDDMLTLNEVKINDESNTDTNNFMADKPDDEFLRPICFDTKRKANNPNLDGEFLKIPKKYVDENGTQIGGNSWWSVNAPADCCDDAALVDIPGNDHFKVQTGGCKQVLNTFGDKHTFMLNFEMSLYLNMSINENNRPHGCRGLETMTMEENGKMTMIGKLLNHHYLHV